MFRGMIRSPAWRDARSSGQAFLMVGSNASNEWERRETCNPQRKDCPQNYVTSESGEVGPRFVEREQVHSARDGLWHAA
jgi:hypothetical protein